MEVYIETTLTSPFHTSLIEIGVSLGHPVVVRKAKGVLFSKAAAFLVHISLSVVQSLHQIVSLHTWVLFNIEKIELTPNQTEKDTKIFLTYNKEGSYLDNIFSYSICNLIL